MTDRSLVKQILEQIKQNKKYKSLSNKIIEEEIRKYLKSNPKTTKKQIKLITKQIRSKLHRLYSSYQTKKKKKRDQYLAELKEVINNKKVNQAELNNITNKLLSITLSTKERLLDYQNIYKQIFKITKKPKIIIDLGAGLNPLSYLLMNLSSIRYYAYDIDLADINFLNNYFKIIKPLGLSGKAAILDIRNLNKISNLPSSDIVLLWKTIDLIDEKTKKISEQLIKLLIKKTKFIVASFSTKTLTRKPMHLPKRRGFELMLKRNNLTYKSFSTNNEIFYVIKK